MFVKQTPSKGRILVTFAESYRVPGTKMTRSRKVRDIGYLDELEKQYDDPIAHFKAEAKRQSEDLRKVNMVSLGEVNTEERFDLGSVPYSKETCKNPSIRNTYFLGQLPLSSIYHELEINSFITNRRSKWHLEANVDAIFKLLVFGRILFPDSKYATWKKRDLLMLGNSEFSDDDIYRSFPFLCEHKNDLIKHLHKHVCSLYNRNSSLMFYDVTNYYWEIDTPDHDVFDDDGNLQSEGLRKKGCSKEHRPEPIVQLGLFMDRDGLPVSYGLFPGNNNDSTTFMPMIEETRASLGMDKMIYIADKGMMSGTNVAKILEQKQGYIISDKVRRQSSSFYEYLFKEKEDDGKDSYTCITEKRNAYEVFLEEQAVTVGGEKLVFTGDKDAEVEVVLFKRKSRLTPHKDEVWKGFDRSLDEKVKISANKKQIVFYSRDYDLRAKADRKDAIEKALKNGTVFNNHGANRYFRKSTYNAETGEFTDKAKAVRYIDMDKVNEDAKLDGYYLIETNVVGNCPDEKRWEGDSRFRPWDLLFELNREVPDSDIIEMYRGLWRIEESFKITKSEFEARPVYCRLEDSIEAHFLSCFVALLITRILELKKLEGYKLGKDRIPYSMIISSLREAHVTRVFDKNLFSNGYYDKVLDCISKATGVDLGKKYFTKQELRSLNNNAKGN